MSLLDIKILSASDSDLNIKYEVEEESTTIEFLEGFADAVTAVEEKCGEIVVSQTGNFILICTYCSERFENIAAFGIHMQYKHFVDNFCDVLNSTENPEPENHMQIENSQDSSNESFCSNSDSGTKENTSSSVNEVFLEDHTSSNDSFSKNFDSGTKNDTNNCAKLKKDLLKVDKWSCDICSRQYMSKSSLSRHQKQHYNSMTLTNEEDVAAATDHNETLENKTTTSEEKLNLLCDLCDRQYSSLVQFKKHATIHSPLIPIVLKEDPTYLKCRYCFEQFSSRLEKLKHERGHARDGRYKCPHCPKAFRGNGDREMHINTHTGKRPFKCPHCPSAFAAKNYLRQHIRCHQDIRKFDCEYCGKQFLRKMDRDIHLRRHTGEKPYQCEECGMSFMVSGLLYQHRIRHTQNRSHQCDVCDKSFFSRQQLQSHQIVHSNDRPHKCNECGTSFPRRKTLLAHVKIHSDIKEYVCNICGKAFAQAAGLYSHKKSHGEKLVGAS